MAEGAAWGPGRSPSWGVGGRPAQRLVTSSGSGTSAAAQDATAGRGGRPRLHGGGRAAGLPTEHPTSKVEGVQVGGAAGSSQGRTTPPGERAAHPRGLQALPGPDLSSILSWTQRALALNEAGKTAVGCPRSYRSAEVATRLAVVGGGVWDPSRPHSSHPCPCGSPRLTASLGCPRYTGQERGVGGGGCLVKAALVRASGQRWILLRPSGSAQLHPQSSPWPSCTPDLLVLIEERSRPTRPSLLPHQH